MTKKGKKSKQVVDGEDASYAYEYEDIGDSSWESEGEWRPYVPLRKRREMAREEIRRRKADGVDLNPIKLGPKETPVSPWGLAWWKNLESWSDFASRLAPGRNYLRRGAVLHLEVSQGNLKALVQGSELYEAQCQVETLGPDAIGLLRADCSGLVSSLVELIAGRIDSGVMALMTSPKKGLFPGPETMTFRCSCPDFAKMCKHVAALLYGFGARLDQSPELLFYFRGVDPTLFMDDVTQTLIQDAKDALAEPWDADQLGHLFDIEWASEK